VEPSENTTEEMDVQNVFFFIALRDCSVLKTRDSNLQPANVVICQSEVGVSNEVKVSRYARRFVLDNFPYHHGGT
jgi:hypothetical protein